MITYKGKIVVVAGPTASGKSDIALKLAQDINGYIINGDSRQVYKYLDIGTAKPVFDKELSTGIYLLNGIKHYLYSFIEPKSNFTLFEYQSAVKEILLKEKGIPILVGGTGLYIDSVVYNYELVKDSKKYTNLESKSITQLQLLAQKYLKDMTQSDRQNKHRLSRAIQRGGVNRKRGTPLDNIYFVVDSDKEVLEQRVRERVEQMFKEGLLEENISLLKRGYTYNDKGMNSIGYMEFKEYFENKIPLDTVKDNIIKNTLSYIKRQRTWFKKHKDSIWENEYTKILYKASNFIKNE